MRALAALGLVLLGAAVGLAAVWTHERWWTLVLGAVATLATAFAVAPGARRLGYAAGWLAAVACFLLARPEGDFVIGSDPPGYAFLGLGLVLLACAVATVPPRRSVTGRPPPTA